MTLILRCRNCGEQVGPPPASASKDPGAWRVCPKCGNYNTLEIKQA